MSLQRFLNAQTPVIDDVMRELRAGKKTGHWMWFIFPQHSALGRTAIAKHYGIASLAEAKAYLADPVLRQRLRDCTCAVLQHNGKSAYAIFGTPDDLKFCSSMTLFSLADPAEPLFAQALAVFYGGKRDALTLAQLGQ